MFAKKKSAILPRGPSCNIEIWYEYTLLLASLSNTVINI